MTQYFAVAEGWRPNSWIYDRLGDAIQDGKDILIKTSRKAVSIYATDGKRVWYLGAISPSVSGFRFTNRDNVTSVINKDGSLRAKPSPKERHPFGL